MLRLKFFIIFTLLFGYGSFVEIDKTWLENVLKHEDKTHQIEKILTVTLSPAVQNGTSPGSEEKRISMDVLLHDGSKIKKSLILKTLPSTPALHKQIEESGIFKTEVLVYKKVLSKMEKFLNNLNDKSEPLWVRALDVREFDQLLLEDAVGDLGYKTANRWKGWDLDHSKLTMKALAKFHALAAVVNEEHHYGEHFKQAVVERNFDELKDFFEVIYNNFAKVIEEKWGPEWTDAAHKVREVAPHVKERLKKLYVERDNILNTLNIGAPNIRNIYFKYAISDLNRSEKPIAVRFSYFQLAFFNSPAHDIQYILNTSPNLEVMTQHRINLLSEYYTSLIHYLRNFGYKGKEPGHDEFINEIKRTNFEGLTTAIQILPYIFEKPLTPEVAEHYAEENANSNTTSLDTSGMYTKEYETIMKVLLKHAIETNVL